MYWIFFSNALNEVCEDASTEFERRLRDHIGAGHTELWSYPAAM